MSRALRNELPSILFDGYTVYKELDAAAVKRTSYENVADVLDAVARLLVKEKSEALAAQPVSEQPEPVASHQVNRDQFHDKVWAIYIQKAQRDSALQNLSIHTVRMFANAMYEAGCFPALAAQPVSKQPAEPSPQISDEEILAVAAEHGYGWASERGVIPFSTMEQDGEQMITLFRALLSRKEGK